MQSALEGFQYSIWNPEKVNGFAHTLQLYSTHFYFLIIVWSEKPQRPKKGSVSNPTTKHPEKNALGDRRKQKAGKDLGGGVIQDTLDAVGVL
jgi:hypothetical protein